MLGDGIATFVAGAIGGPANTTYGENTSVVGMTKVASVWVIGLAAIIAIALGFFSKFTALVSTIPNAVLGGVSLLLYGFIAVNGLKVLIQNQVNFNNTKNVIVASAMLVLGLGGAAISIVNGDLSVTISGMSLAAIVGIILNLCLPTEKEEEKVVVNVLNEQETKKTKKVNKEIESTKITNKNKKETIKEELKSEKVVETKKQPAKKKTTSNKVKEENKPKKTAANKTSESKTTTTKKKTSTQKNSTSNTKTTNKKKENKKEEANV